MTPISSRSCAGAAAAAARSSACSARSAWSRRACRWSGAARSADEDLLVFDWSGYEIPELHKPYIAKYGKSPTITIFADDEEAYIKIKGGFRCDLVHPTSYAIGRYRDQGMLKPIDVAGCRTGRT